MNYEENTHSSRILLVDDEPVILSMLSRTLVRAGYIVTAVSDGQKAWEALQAGAFDILVTDHQMPNLTGFELVTRMRRQGMTIPIIVMSAVLDNFSDGDEDFLHIAHFLQKPFSLQDAVDAVAHALQPA